MPEQSFLQTYSTNYYRESSALVEYNIRYMMCAVYYNCMNVLYIS